MKSKAIILIGPDKSGKSTLCKKLQKEYSELTYSKGSKMPINDMIGKVVRLLVEMKTGQKSYIFDRFHYPEELIYGSLNRDSLPFSVSHWFVNGVAEKLRDLNAIIIYCFADIDTLKKRFSESDETDIKVEWYERLLRAYGKWVKRTDFPILKLDSSKLTEEEMFDKAKEFIKANEN